MPSPVVAQAVEAALHGGGKSLLFRPSSWEGKIAFTCASLSHISRRNIRGGCREALACEFVKGQFAVSVNGILA